MNEGEHVKKSSAVVPLAHSAKDDSSNPDEYSRHVAGTKSGARDRCVAMLQYASDPPRQMLETVDAAATFHDLGKLDEDIQAVLSGGRSGRLVWDHIDAGVSHLSRFAKMAAWIVRAHHAPGLPEKGFHFPKDIEGRELRGRRNDARKKFEHDEQIDRTDGHLDAYLKTHTAVLGEYGMEPIKGGAHGLSLRLALSCLVDADHADTAFFDSGFPPAKPADPRWEERLARLKTYIADLPSGETEAEVERNQMRQKFFDSCSSASIEGSLFACEGPVGIGKTTAITAFLLQLATRKKLRRIIIVAPYTNILVQTAKRLREALLLPDEQSLADQIIVEQHHRADFSSRESRSLASLWNAPIVLTTAVGFFESIAACDPGTLRKLHALPGSAVFLDEAHAALPAHLWPQNWKWICELSKKWSCNFVMASGTLTRFWQDDEIVQETVELPELIPANQREVVFDAEQRRVTYKTINHAKAIDVAILSDAVLKSPGPRLVILNTVQNAAVFAKHLQSLQHDTIHLSTALTPADREVIYDRIIAKLGDTNKTEWTLVATSCVEAGVDFSFRTAFRERFSAASILQVGGRVNRNAEYEHLGGSVVYDFALCDAAKKITQHPAAKESTQVLLRMISDNRLNTLNPSDAASQAMREEISSRGGLKQDELVRAEAVQNYPKVKELARVINADTYLVAVDSKLKQKLAQREKVSFRELLHGSVQLWGHKIDQLGMEPFHYAPEIFQWNDAYDPNFLGYMEGVLKQSEFLDKGGSVV
jgi:CRISPR-associated endonuclease/helicase Cas3